MINEKTSPAIWGFLFLGLVLIQLISVFLIVLAPSLGLLLIRYLLLFILAGFAFLVAAPAAPFWIRALYVVILGSFILNYGFSNFSVGFGGARVTIAELVLMFCLLWVALRSWSALWVGGGLTFVLLLYALPPLIIHLPKDILKYGIVAARDALPLFDSMFFLGGAAIVAFARNAEQWKAWRHRFFWLLLVAAMFYLPLYPFRAELLAYSPRVTGFQQSVPIFGNFDTGNVLALAGLLAVILVPRQILWRPDSRSNWWWTAFAFCCFGVGVVMTQSRTTYITAILSVFLLGLNRHGKAARRLFAMGAVAILVLALIDFSGVQIRGRVGNIGLEMLTSQLESSTGQAGLESARAGVDQRKRWISNALDQWSESLQTFTTGIGFGEPLTDLTVSRTKGTTVVVREPHNSFVSVLTRTGLMGFLPWMIFHIVFILRISLEFRDKTRSDDREEASFWLWLLLLFLSILLSAFVQPVFETPQFAIPYYFMAGICLGEIHRNRTGWIPFVK